MKLLALRNSKTVFSRGRGCIFQGFQYLHKSDEKYPEMGTKMTPKSLKRRSGGLPKRTSKTYTKNIKKHTQKVLQNEVMKSGFFNVFKGLGPREPQGGPEDPPRCPKWVCGDHFGVTLGSLWSYFGIILESLWDHVGITLG